MNQNQTFSGWRKRQIALDIKAENARELGLDYEPNNGATMNERICKFAVEAGPDIEKFAEFVREFIDAAVKAEREECAKLCDWLNGEPRLMPSGCAAAIRTRSKHE